MTLEHASEVLPKLTGTPKNQTNLLTSVTMHLTVVLVSS
jgi:hypothetical protein